MDDGDTSRQGEAAPQDVLAALGEVIRAVSSSGFELDEVLQTIVRHAVELSRADFGNILRPAAPGEILLSQRLNTAVESTIATEAVPEKSLKGFSRPVQAFRVTGG